MKIAYFSDSFYPELSGISDSILLTGTELAKRGHEMHFFVPKYSKKNYSINHNIMEELSLGENVHIHRISSFPVKTPTQQGRGTLPNIFRGLFLGNKFDVIHTHSFSPMGLDALCLSRIKKIPIVGTNHTIVESFRQYYPSDSKWMMNLIVRYVTWFYNKCDKVTTPSLFLKDDMFKKGLIKPVEVISNPISKGFFIGSDSKINLKKKLGLTNKTILYAGRISEEKNIFTLLKAFILLSKEDSEAELVLVGHGPIEKNIQKIAQENNISNRVKLPGSYTGENIQTLYDFFHASDVLVMPSVAESQSMVVIQAMASNLPIIASECGPIPNLLKEDKGVLFDPNNPEDLSKKLLLLLNDNTLCEKISKNARVFAENFSVEKVADEWEKLYSNIQK